MAEPSWLNYAVTGCTTIAIPLVVWIYKQVTTNTSRLDGLEDKYESLCEKVADIATKDSHTDERLSKIDLAVSEIRGSVQRSEEQFKAITIKLDRLDVLAKVETLLDSFQHSINAIVPRREVDERMADMKRRLELLENDVRKRS